MTPTGAADSLATQPPAIGEEAALGDLTGDRVIAQVGVGLSKPSQRCLHYGQSGAEDSVR